MEKRNACIVPGRGYNEGMTNTDMTTRAALAYLAIWRAEKACGTAKGDREYSRCEDALDLALAPLTAGEQEAAYEIAEEARAYVAAELAA